MSEPEWKRQSRIKEEAWRWAHRRLRLEVVVDEVELGLSDDQVAVLEHVKKVVCKTLLRQADRIAARRGSSGKDVAEDEVAELIGYAEGYSDASLDKKDLVSWKQGHEPE